MSLLDGELTPVDIDQHNRAQREPTGSPSDRTPEQRSRDMDICLDAHDPCAEATDRVAAEGEYIVSHGGDANTLALMQLIREQAQTTGSPFVVSCVPDPRAGELQIAWMRARHQAVVAQLEDARGLLSCTFERVIAALDKPPFDMDALHAAIEAGDTRTLLHLAARSAFIDANASHTQLDIIASRILRGTLKALASATAGDTKHLKAIAKEAEPEPRDMHATERSETRIKTLEHMHQQLGGGLAKLWGAITVDEIVAWKKEIERRYRIEMPNAERAAREEMEAFQPARAPGALARIFVGSVELIPAVFIDRGVQFSTEERYTPEGAIDGSPDPQKLKPVEAAYQVRIETWEPTRDKETITDRAIDLIEEGLKALGMDRKRDADAVVSFLRKRKDRATQREADPKEPDAKEPEIEPEDMAP